MEELIPHFLKNKGLARQHIDSFDYFVQVEMPNLIKANEKILSDVEQHFYVKFTKIYVGFPENQEQYSNHILTPHECRLRDLTYSGNIFVDIEYTRDRQIVKRKGIPIGRLPIMLQSKKCILYNKSESEKANLMECAMDSGGFFIVKGVEKVILIQEQLSKNRIIIERDKYGIVANVTSSSLERKTKTYVFSKQNKIYMKQNCFVEDIPIVIIFKAMGLASDNEICTLVAGNDKNILELFAPNVEDAAKLKIFTQRQALLYISGKVRSMRATTDRTIESKIDEVLEILGAVLLSHIEVNKTNFRLKCIYTAIMCRRVILTADEAQTVDDRDFIGNKRLELAGSLMSLLFEDLFKKFCAELKVDMDRNLKKKSKTPFDAFTCLRMHADTITSGFVRALSTGNWSLKRFRMERSGVTQVLTRLSYISAIGQVGRINSQFEKSRKISGPRALQPSQVGVFCPADTPEGESCGLVKNLALLTHVTNDLDTTVIKEFAFSLGLEDINTISGESMYTENTWIVFLNGTILGITKSKDLFLNRFRLIRRKGKISEFVSINKQSKHQSIQISCDGGRVCRPLIIVEHGQPKITEKHLDQLKNGILCFQDLFLMGLIEYLDVNEENDCLIAFYKKDLTLNHTHLEIEPYTILGAVAGLIPYPHHNQSPRNTYQCAMGKQAQGFIGYNMLHRIDTLMYMLVYSQKPMVKTKTIDYIGFDKLPAGHNAIVAVMSYSGYDIEDALILNKASLDRGFGRVVVYRKNASIIKSYPNGTSDRLVPPPVNSKSLKSFKKYENIDSDGCAAVGEIVQPNHVLLNIQNPVVIDQNSTSADVKFEYHNRPISLKSNVPVIVDKVLMTMTEGGHKLVKVLTRQTRRPEIGDKFSSRHGQKGVTGLIVNQADLPFNDEGICPDIIMNPHGFPSRMTVGKMIELLAGKAGLFIGKQQYGTAFGGSTVQDMSQILVDNGYNYCGKDYLTSGITGEPLEAYIFMGPVYYQKLKHMVMDKIHSRGRGPRTALTRQPTEGRSRDGGLRLGEMERDCLIAYGASMLILERLMISSDAFQVHVCGECGLIVNEDWCKYCQSSLNLHPMMMPYAAKLLFQELQAMNIVPRLRLQENK